MKTVIYPVNKRSVTAGDIGKWAKKNGCDLVIEVHFNAVKDPKSNGCETLTDYNQRDGIPIKNIHRELVKLGWRDRGFKPCNGGGGRSLQNPRLVRQEGIQYMLLELCFISNVNDMALFDKHMDTIPSIILKTARESGVRTLGIVYGHGGNDVGAEGINGRREAVEVRRLDFTSDKVHTETEESVLDMTREELDKLIDDKITSRVKESEVNTSGQSPDHWSESPFQSLQQEGIVFHERRFNDYVTRGEMYQALWNVVSWVKRIFKK